MSKPPNILFLMADQMRGRALRPESPCLTPNIDRIAAQGVRFDCAYTPNAVCSPARASLMTGLLPHNHGVLTVTHTVDEDQCCLRTNKPHWAQRLSEKGYQTGYFGKWHVERSEQLGDFGWQVDCNHHSEVFRQREASILGDEPAKPEYSMAKYYEGRPGYRQSMFYGVTNRPPEKRSMGVTTSLALEFLEDVTRENHPWCCFVSVREPHDPFIAGQEAFSRYDPAAIELPPNVHDDLAGRPGIYRKSARTWANLTDKEHREAAACYYASITEIDEQWGRLVDALEKAGVLEDTLVIIAADHGEHLGAHGLYCKNYMASEEVYNVPLIVRGPGVARGVTSKARVGSHELCPTLLELTGCEPFEQVPDSRSFAHVLADPAAHHSEFTRGFAEYFGTRFTLTQRVVWDGPWKFVLNGFDFDELYNLEEDPYELTNLAADPAYRERVQSMMTLAWQRIRDTGDHALLNTQYPALRIAAVGPMLLDEEAS